MGNLYCTVTDIENEIRATTSFSDSTYPTRSAVLQWIEKESDWIDDKAGTKFASELASSSYFDYDGSGIFRFPFSPLVSITSFEYNVNSLGVSPSWVSLEEGYNKNYLLYKEEGEVEFVSGEDATNKVVPKAGKKRFRVTYNYGSEDVPSNVSTLCTLLVVKRIIRAMTSSQANKEGGSIQVGTIRVTSPTNFTVNYVKSLNDDIDGLVKSLGTDFKVFKGTRIYD